MVPVSKPNDGYARIKMLDSGSPLHAQLARFIVTKKKTLGNECRFYADEIPLSL